MGLPTDPTYLIRGYMGLEAGLLSGTPRLPTPTPAHPGQLRKPYLGGKGFASNMTTERGKDPPGGSSGGGWGSLALPARCAGKANAASLCSAFKRNVDSPTGSGPSRESHQRIQERPGRRNSLSLSVPVSGL